MTQSDFYIKHLYDLGWRVKESKLYNNQGNEMAFFVDSQGYLRYSYYYKGKSFRIMIHRFIAYQKYGDCIFDKSIEVRHLDGDKANISESNIQIGTHVDNMQDIPKETRIKYAINASYTNRRFTDNEVIEIIKDRENGFTYSQLCKKWNTSKSTLSFLFNKSLYAK